MNPAAKDVDTYLAAVPKEPRAALEKLRSQIKAIAPGATETISYQIPTFKLHGYLVAYSAHKKHCSLHLMSRAIAKALEDDLKPYEHTIASVHFTADQPLPAALVKKLVEARIAENESRSNK